ncbi:hypothetical protein CIG11343_0646 [Campylobacter iguaniorum]|uniref:hypothetical protein n=1 Tax=Campylobacter iguaniorum TaxID=1244531 RepID=UPI0007C968DF|nr:hypothetical protein [Campylobacter iguaniorum]ANE35698.1 hypothetical protein CIG11343_0646 [Campylobacter iguaniorum]
MSVREYFDRNCISIRAWAKKHELNERVAYMVINKEFIGSDKSYAKGKKVRMAKNVEQIALETLFG